MKNEMLVPNAANFNITDSNNNFYNGVNKVENNYLNNRLNQADFSEFVKPRDYLFYSLFVTDEDFFNGSFLIPKTMIFSSDNTDDEIRSLHSRLKKESQKKLCMYPTLFVQKNKSVNSLTCEERVGYGYIKKIEVQSDSVMISCIAINLENLNKRLVFEKQKDIGIKSVMACGELDEVHWAVKRINLINFLKRNEVQVPYLGIMAQE